jgi:tetratricopeptide (TPR) repeat protein
MPNMLRSPARRPSLPAHWYALALISLASACATGGARAPDPAHVAALESRLLADPGSADAALQVAAVYRESGRAGDAIRLLEPVVAADPSDPAAVFLLALSYETDGRLADARRSYETFLDGGAPPALGRKVRDRLDDLGRQDLGAAARAAIAREQSLQGTTPDASTIGVFPFLFAAQDASLEPLSRALAEMLTTDLGQTDRLTVVERAQVQALLDELRLAESGRVDPATAARAGRLVGAGRLVQGRIDGTSAALRLQATVVPVASPKGALNTVERTGEIARLFDMEKELAFAIYDGMGVQLTVAERERVSRRPTDNVQALLAFGFGLEAWDGGRWTDAIDRFGRAVQLDPRFTEASTYLDRARRRAGQADEDPDGGLSGLARLGEQTLGWNLPRWQRRRLRFAGIDPMVPDPGVRDPIPEVLGAEGLDRRALVEVIIRRPTGNQP